MENIVLRLNRISREKNIPLFASFELTYKCNLKCIHCYKLEEEKEELDTDEVKDIILQLKNSGSLFLLFTGGEVLLRRDFIEILRFASKLNFAIKIFTNGTLIRKETTERIADFAPEVGVSVYSAKQEVHDLITGVSGSFNKTIQGIKSLREKGLKVRIKCVLMKENFDDYESIIKLAKNLGVGFGFDPSIVPKNNGDKEPLKHRIGYEELLKIYRDEKLYPKENFLDTFHSNKQVCSAGRNVISINPYGDVYPCLMLLIRLGNLREESFKNIWSRSEEVLNLRKIEFADLVKCPECDLLNYCSRCIGVAYLEEGNIRSPLKRACEVARARKEAKKFAY